MEYFNSVEFLEPKCPKCGIVLDYGTNTEFKDDVNAHVCLMCGHILR
ncbi:hypothetical protein JXC34_03490 [Candidatus Woesearchaeota archaeon]|nr:hypothetical protein [Candidatus Woesearchaeota archaeon]